MKKVYNREARIRALARAGAALVVPDRETQSRGRSLDGITWRRRGNRKSAQVKSIVPGSTSQIFGGGAWEHG